MVKWSANSPSTPMVQAQIPLKLTVLYEESVVENNKNKYKDARAGLFFIKDTVFNANRACHHPRPFSQ